MGYYTPDPYNQPEAFELKIVDYLDDPEASYSFNYLVVWEHKDGRLFWATDSGCSCPSPFEDYTSLRSLELITIDEWDKFKVAVEQHCFYDNYRDGSGNIDPQIGDKVQLLAKVMMRLLKKESSWS